MIKTGRFEALSSLKIMRLSWSMVTLNMHNLDNKFSRNITRQPIVRCKFSGHWNWSSIYFGTSLAIQILCFASRMATEFPEAV